MFGPLHDAIVKGQVERLRQRIVSDGWTDTSVDQRGAIIYVTIRASARGAYLRFSKARRRRTAALSKD
jgi:hypothetical protein